MTGGGNGSSAAGGGDPRKVREEARQAAIAEARRRLEIQKEALKNLPPSTLFVMLYMRTDPPAPNDFHWGLYYHRDANGGTKYHITNEGSGWLPGHGPTGGAMRSNALICLIPIATIPPQEAGNLDQIARRYDNTVNTHPSMTCRVWVLMAIRDLISAHLVRCSNINALERECFDAGNRYSTDRLQPRPVVRPESCG
jgi:hypothetical protein